jgi:hypothetical protein
VGGEAEELRRKELLRNIATLVPMREARILGAKRDLRAVTINDGEIVEIVEG